MKLLKFINPFFLFKKRNKIIPETKRIINKNAGQFAKLIRVNFAKRGLGITSNDRKLLALKDKHKGEPCFIIGNGPSLKISDLQKLHEVNQITFAFNKIYLAFDQTDWRPTYYIVEDSLVAQLNKNKITKLEPFTKLFPLDFINMYRHLENTIFYYINWKDFWPDNPLFTANPLRLHWGATVTYTALQFAIYFGCNPIYLIGIDFSFIEPKKHDSLDNRVIINNGEQNHFHPKYRKKGEKWFIPRLEHQKKSFKSARCYARANNIEIINATNGGKLEVFERRNLTDILNSIK